MRGAVFETFVVAEVVKSLWHAGLEPDLYFWRDSEGHEVDLLVETGKQVLAVEVKSAETFATDFTDGLDYLQKLSKKTDIQSMVVYGEQEPMKYKNHQVWTWNQWG